MKNRGWILCGIAVVAATYIIVNRSRTDEYPADYNDLESAANRAADWGSKQRIQGAVANLLGKLKEGFGRATGDHDVAEEGVADQVRGAVKDTAGRAAHVASDMIHDFNR
jgi:uncharacterized protein YjbJ (UPF0337 family)